MAVGKARSAFQPAQSDRIERAVASAELESGLRFSVAIGPQPSDAGGDLSREARTLAAGYPEPVGGVLIVIDPAARRLEIVTTGSAHRRIPDRSCGLAALAITSRMVVGDVVGAVLDAVRMLTEVAGPSDRGQPAIEVGTETTPPHVRPALSRGGH